MFELYAQFRFHGADGVLPGEHRPGRYGPAEADTVTSAAGAAKAGETVRVYTAKSKQSLIIIIIHLPIMVSPITL